MPRRWSWENALVDPNTRQGKRTPVTLKIKFKSETLEQFIERYAVDVDQGGIFIRTKDPLAVGTQMKFEFQLQDASPLIAGEGTVVWTREFDPTRAGVAPGMGVRFDRLAEGSQSVLEKILAEKAKQAPQRGVDPGGKPPMFTDQPTRVAPLLVQDALLGPNRGRNDSEQTPLPAPTPFHSDADEFGAEAFEEATKVRALDDLVAATADDPEPKAVPADELAARRAPSTAAEDSAPALPSAPGMSDAGGASGRTGKLLDTSPSPRPQSPSVPPPRVSQPMPSLAQTDKGDKGDKETKRRAPSSASSRRAVRAQRITRSERATSARATSSAPIVIGVVVVIAVALAAIWYFGLRGPAEREVAKHDDTIGSADIGSAAATPGSGVLAAGGGSDLGGSAGNAGSAGSAGSAYPAVSGSAEAPKAATVDTEIVANVSSATATVVDTGDSGQVPYKAKLEKDKSYKVRVTAPGYAPLELDVKGGQDKMTAKLVAKPHVPLDQSTPPGATIYIDSGATGHVTPYDIELVASQAARPKLRVTLRKSGYKSADQVIASSAYSEEDQRLVAPIDATLAPAPASVAAPRQSPSSGTSSRRARRRRPRRHRPTATRALRAQARLRRRHRQHHQHQHRHRRPLRVAASPSQTSRKSSRDLMRCRGLKAFCRNLACSIVSSAIP